MLRSFAVLCAAAAAPSLASAQFDDQWISYSAGGAHLQPPPLSISDATTSLPGDTPGAGLTGTKTELAWADLDKDGWTDLVVARKQPYSTEGKRTNLLLINDDGVLTDRTAALASASDVPGDLGFLTPTNDADVAIADVNGDTWLDVVTAATLSDGDPKHVSHPRVYINLGRDASGQWLGLRYEETRVPQLFSFATGQPQAPRFNSVSIGDLTGDGAADLYFTDIDVTGVGGLGEPPTADLNDRLLVNDGNGWFTDQSVARMSHEMLLSSYGVDSAIADLNADGAADLLKCSLMLPPQNARAIYNNPAIPGFFALQDAFHQGFAPSYLATGDLNRDGRTDIAIVDDFTDRWRVNLGSDAQGRVIWSAANTFDFLVGGDDGFGGNDLIADLDGDGWPDVLVCDVDDNIAGSTRRLHIYHNRGGTIGGSDLVLREERESTSDAGWIGVVGLTAATMEGTHDVAAFDVDNDLDPDLVVSRVAGTELYAQDGGVVCQRSVGFGGPGYSTLSVCGGDLAVAGATADVRLAGAPESAPSIWAISDQMSAVPLSGGFLVAFPPLALGALTTSAAGEIFLPAALTGNASGLAFYLQAATLDLGLPSLWSISNAVEIQL